MVRALGVSCEVELDDVRVEGALGEEVDVAQPAGLDLEDLDEGAPDPPPLLLGVGDPGQRGEEAVGGVDVHQLDLALVGHHLDHPPALAAAEQPVVDEDAGQLIAHGSVHEGRGHRRVDPAREGAEHAALPDPGADVAIAR